MIVGQATNSFRCYLCAIWPTCTRYSILFLSLSPSPNIFNLFFFLSRNGRIRNAAPSFLPENYPECESWSLTRLESRSQTGVTFPRRCGSFIGIVFPVLPLSQRERSPLLISCFSAHSDLKLNIRSWSWWVLDFKDTFEKMIKYRYKFFSLEIFGYFIFFFFFWRTKSIWITNWAIFVINRNGFLKCVYIEYTRSSFLFFIFTFLFLFY